MTPGPNVVHEHLVGGELVLHRRPGVVCLLELDPVPQVVHALHPQAGLFKYTKLRPFILSFMYGKGKASI